MFIPVDISPDNITPVCLPTFGQSFDGDKATVAGKHCHHILYVKMI